MLLSTGQFFNGSGGGGGPGNPNPPEYRTTVTSTTNASSYTFAATDIGSADAARVVVIAFGWNTIADVAVTGVTIGGITATIIQEHAGATGSAIAYAAVPTGTAASIVITYAGTGPRNCHCSVYKIIPASTTPVDSGTATDTANTAVVPNISVVGNGALIWCGQTSSSGVTFSESYDGSDTATEDYDAILETTSHFASYSVPVSSSETVNPGITSSGLATKYMCAVSFGPAA